MVRRLEQAAFGRGLLHLIIGEGGLAITLVPTRKSAQINPLIALGVTHLEPSLRAVLTVLLNNSATQD